MLQEFEFILYEEPKYCWNCSVVDCYFQTHPGLCSCDRWGIGPAYKEGTKEVADLLINILKTWQKVLKEKPELLGLQNESKNKSS